MNKIYIQEYKSPVGELIIGVFEDRICICDWKFRKQRLIIDERIKKYFNADFVIENKPIIQETVIQLNEYFTQKREDFELPIVFAGTNFQKKVWQELQKIPFGRTLSYLQLSKNLNQPLAIRAVASANGANAISIIVPCHRIIGSKGELVGYAGGIITKKKLLSMENKIQIEMELY
ncbi:MAG: methylated-DNA--[protein]-cysteine S-methyltransferase [Flavobacterium sp.]